MREAPQEAKSARTCQSSAETGAHVQPLSSSRSETSGSAMSQLRDFDMMRVLRSMRAQSPTALPRYLEM